MPPTQLPASGNPLVFFDITLGGEPLGRVTFELFADTTPKTAENFRQFCTGERPKDKRTWGYLSSARNRGLTGPERLDLSVLGHTLSIMPDRNAVVSLPSIAS
ncbi:hypothetical protein BN1723_002182 [Verticillium longisporum]|uniref:peptidylprolyl isomerase n=1 Tax=Verticillium longisporum TaxID=100787 RepID=A0A0G4L004_VERLO|nr:hypothetical protein BN1723_002182 [Verticillium longisporum]